MKVRYEESTKYKMLQRLSRLSANVVLRSDFEDIGNERQISRGLQALQKDGVIAKIGFGVYAKAYKTKYLDIPVIKGGFNAVCKEALNKLNACWEPGTAEQAYNKGISTQVPARVVVKLKSRLRRKIAYGSQQLIIEQGINAK